MTQSRAQAGNATPAQPEPDPSWVAFHQREMGIVYPPVKHEQPLRGRAGRTGFGPVALYPSAVASVSIDALGLYAVIAVRLDGELPVDIDDLAEAVGRDQLVIEELVDELFRHGLLVDPTVREAQNAVYEAANRAAHARAEAEREARRIKAAPDPWPQYGPGRWIGGRDFLDLPPDGHLVYRLLGEDGDLLYVGVSKSFRTRLRGHFDKPWRSWEAREALSHDDALWLEAGEIVWTKPPLNRDRELFGRARFVPRRRPAGGAW